MAVCYVCNGERQIWVPCLSCKGKKGGCGVCVGMGQVRITCGRCGGKGEI